MCKVWGDHVILGAARLKNWEVWGKKENLLFALPLQIKHNNKGEKILSALCPIHLQPLAGHNLPNWIDREKRKRKKKKKAVFHMKLAQHPLVI